MIIVDGKKVATKIKAATKAALAEFGEDLNFHCLLVGDDPASLLYIKRKQEYADEIGIKFNLHQLPSGASKAEVTNLMDKLNTTAHGYIVQLPLPEHLQDETDNILRCLDVSRDADGLTGDNRKNLLAGRGGFLPTPIAAVMVLLQSLYEASNLVDYLPFNGDQSKKLPPQFDGKSAVVISDGDVFAPTLVEVLNQAGLKAKAMSSFDCEFEEINADIVITALGKPGFLVGDMIKSGATVIDVGTTLVDGKTVGDVDWESIQKKAGAATPVPGGVGPVTVAMLYANLLALAKNV